MDNYGTTSKGRFIIEEISILPKWSVYDKGRFVFVSDENNYYLGGTQDWIRFNNNGKLKVLQLDVGPKVNQVNAYTIPVRNLSMYFSNADSIEHVLERLATGQYFQSNILINRHYAELSITLDKIKTGLNSNEVGAHAIPFYDPIRKNVITVDEAINNLYDTVPTIINKRVTIDMWDYDSVEGLYVTSFMYVSARTDYPIFQCYDSFGSMFMPSKVLIQPEFNKIKMWSPYKLELYATIMG